MTLSLLAPSFSLGIQAQGFDWNVTNGQCPLPAPITGQAYTSRFAQEIAQYESLPPLPEATEKLAQKFFAEAAAPQKSDKPQPSIMNRVNRLARSASSAVSRAKIIFSNALRSLTGQSPLPPAPWPFDEKFSWSVLPSWRRKKIENIKWHIDDLNSLSPISNSPIARENLPKAKWNDWYRSIPEHDQPSCVQYNRICDSAWIPPGTQLGKDGRTYVVVSDDWHRGRQNLIKNLKEEFIEWIKDSRISYHLNRDAIIDRFYARIRKNYEDSPEMRILESWRLLYPLQPSPDTLLEDPKHILDRRLEDEPGENNSDLVAIIGKPKNEIELEELQEAAFKPWIDKLYQWWDQFRINLQEVQNRFDDQQLPGWDEFEKWRLDQVRHDGLAMGVDSCDIRYESGVHPSHLQDENRDIIKLILSNLKAIKQNEFHYDGYIFQCYPKDMKYAVPSVEMLMKWRLEDYEKWLEFQRLLETSEFSEDERKKFDQDMKCIGYKVQTTTHDKFPQLLSGKEMFKNWEDSYEPPERARRRQPQNPCLNRQSSALSITQGAGIILGGLSSLAAIFRYCKHKGPNKTTVKPEAPKPAVLTIETLVKWRHEDQEKWKEFLRRLEVSGIPEMDRHEFDEEINRAGEKLQPAVAQAQPVSLEPSVSAQEGTAPKAKPILEKVLEIAKQMEAEELPLLEVEPEAPATRPRCLSSLFGRVAGRPNA